MVPKATLAGGCWRNGTCMLNRQKPQISINLYVTCNFQDQRAWLLAPEEDLLRASRVKLLSQKSWRWLSKHRLLCKPRFTGSISITATTLRT